MKTVLITGGSAGIGKVTAQHLAKQGNRLIIVGRDAVKGQALVDSFKREFPQSPSVFYAVDMADFAQVRKFAQTLKAQGEKLDTMVLNAGLFMPQLKTNADGYEYMFATTHLGHFLLTHELIETLLQSADPRIIVTASVAHRFVPGLNFEQLHFADGKLPKAPSFMAYGRSKLSNILFVRELARRYAGTALKVNAFHPGAIRSEIWRDTPSIFNLVIDPFLQSPEQGAKTQIYLADKPNLQETGQYFFVSKVDPGNKPSRDMALARKLWEYSEQAVGIKNFGKAEASARVA